MKGNIKAPGSVVSYSTKADGYFGLSLRYLLKVGKRRTLLALLPPKPRRARPWPELGFFQGCLTTRRHSAATIPPSQTRQVNRFQSIVSSWLASKAVVFTPASVV